MKKHSGIDAAFFRSSDSGILKVVSSSAIQYSAYPPPFTSAATLSPFLNFLTFCPISSTIPDISSPNIFECPSGAG